MKKTKSKIALITFSLILCLTMLLGMTTSTVAYALSDQVNVDDQFSSALNNAISYTEVTNSTPAGQRVQLGTYTWRVLETDSANNVALLLCDVVVENRAFDSSSNIYAGSEIQTYIAAESFCTNKLGIENASTVVKRVSTPDADAKTTYSGSATGDYCFLLSYEDVFGTSAFSAVNTAEKRKRGESTTGFADFWCLRSTVPETEMTPEEDRNNICTVSSFGYSHSFGIAEEYGLVPALYIGTTSNSGVTPSTGIETNVGIGLAMSIVTIVLGAGLIVIESKRKNA